MLTKDLLRVSRAGGGYRPQFADGDDRDLAERVLSTYDAHVGESRATLEEALTAVEREADDFKLVRGFAALVDRDATFETQAPLDPTLARRAAFEAAEAVGVTTEDERVMALVRAGEELGVPADDVADSLYADLDERQVLAAVDSRWSADDLLAQYNLSLAQTALFDALEVTIRSSDPKALVSAIKRLRLMYEIRRVEPDEGEGLAERDEGDGTAERDEGEALVEREVIVTGPTQLFRATRRYGTRFARLLRTVARAEEWSLSATIDDRGTERTLELSHEDPVRVPDAEPVADVEYDSSIERDFATRFTALDLDWTLRREPEALATGARVMIPDFAFEYDHAPFRLYFEIMGFWTPEYVEKKLDQLEGLEEVDLVVAVDESLGVGEAVEALDHRVIPYSGSVRVKDVRAVLREYEREFEAESAAALPDDLVPDDDVVSIATLAERHGVGEGAIEEQAFPEHDQVGRTLVRPAVLDGLVEELDDGMTFADAEGVLDDAGIDDASAALSRLGFRVEWEGLGGGVLREREE